MSRQLLSIDSRGLPDLVGSDFGALQSLAIPVRANQGVLERGCFLRTDGSRALVATQVDGVLSNRVNSDVPEAEDRAATIFTAGRFLLATVKRANPQFVFDEAALSTLAARSIILERAYGTTGWQ
jgi:hypothetical protein